MTDRISNAGNTIVPAILVIESKGYRVSWKRGPSAPDDEQWLAEGPLGSFCAEDPVTLLGLIAMREARGQDWKASDSQIDEFAAKYQAG